MCLGFLTIFILMACWSSPKCDIANTVSKWHGKVLKMSLSLKPVVMGRDTISNFNHTSYAIVTYIDSSNCTSCRLRLSMWKEMISEINSFDKDTIPVYFILHPISLKELTTILVKNNFYYPIYIDENDRFKQLNNLSDNEIFHTFLINKANEVVAVGNPIHNTKIKELYQKIIFGNNVTERYEKRVTISRFDKSSIDLGRFHWEQEMQNEFILSNTGANPLVVIDVSTSCGCTSVEYNKEPVKPGDELKLIVKYKADEPGHFSKSIKVFCNTKDSPISLKITGEALAN